MIDGVTGECIDMTFKLHDRIEFLGAQGTIMRLHEGPYDLMHPYRIEVILDSGRTLFFMTDGRLYPEFDVRMVKVGTVVPRVKKWRWVCTDELGRSWIAANHFSESKAEAALKDHKTSIQRIEVTEIEVEDDLH